MRTHAHRPQWPRGLRPGSAAAHLLSSRVRIPPGHGCLCLVTCCVLSCRCLCDELITRPEESTYIHTYIHTYVNTFIYIHTYIHKYILIHTYKRTLCFTLPPHGKHSVTFLQAPAQIRTMQLPPSHISPLPRHFAL